MTDPSRLRISGPLTIYVEEFAGKLTAQGYSDNAMGAQLRLMAHVSRWLETKHLSAERLTPERRQAFAAHRRAVGYRSACSALSLRTLMAFLEGAGVEVDTEPPTWLDRFCDDYEGYLVSERALLASTIVGYLAAARAFVAHARISGRDGLEILTAVEVRAFALAEARRLTPKGAGNRMGGLRSLLHYLYVSGVTPTPLGAAVPSIAGWQQGVLPRGIDPAQVEAILAGCDRTSVVGRRDFAILVMLARLGLRAGEVAGLGLDDVDWRAGELSVLGKGRTRDRLPVPTEVGEALADYVEYSRPSGGSRSLFRLACAPFGPMTMTGVRAVLRRACWRVGLADTGAHPFRHTLATDILARGGSLAEIGQLLRHADLATTAIYAKVDHNALGALALPWPRGAA
jgi:site-specific recombinase XerD